MNSRTSFILGLVSLLLIIVIIYKYDPSVMKMFGGSQREGFADNNNAGKTNSNANGKNNKNDQDDTDDHDTDCRCNRCRCDNRRTRQPSNKQDDDDDNGRNNKNNNTKNNKENFVNSGPAELSEALPPAGCYPRDQLTPSELLPMDQNSIWAQQNPMGSGSLKGKNFLSAGALIGVNTVGQTLRNANQQIRSEPPNPQAPVSIFNQSTIAPDMNRRPLEIGA